MKKAISVFVSAVILGGITACGDEASDTVSEEISSSSITTTETSTEIEIETESESEAETELIVFAAASMTETLDQIIELYKAEVPNVTIIPTYDSSGTLKTQIQECADCDIFISAAQKQMNQLDITTDNDEGLDYVLHETRIDLLENKVALAVPDDNKADIQSFSDLGTDKLTLLGIGNEDVPVGAYSLEILESLGILDSLEESGKLTYGTNVKEVTSQVKEGVVDAGIIYATDAFSADLKVVDEADESLCRRVIYPAAVLNITNNEEAARDFLEYLQSDEAAEIFEAVGFTPLR